MVCTGMFGDSGSKYDVIPQTVITKITAATHLQLLYTNIVTEIIQELLL